MANEGDMLYMYPGPDMESMKKMFGEDGYREGLNPVGFAGLAYQGENGTAMQFHKTVMKESMDWATPNFEEILTNGSGFDDETRNGYVRYRYENFFNSVEDMSLGATLGISQQDDLTIADMSREGLGMYNRATVGPMLDSMYGLDEKYHFMDDDFKQYLSSLDIEGVGDLSKYEHGQFDALDKQSALNVDAMKDMYVDSVQESMDIDPSKYYGANPMNVDHLTQFVKEHDNALYGTLDIDGADYQPEPPRPIDRFAYFSPEMNVPIVAGDSMYAIDLNPEKEDSLMKDGRERERLGNVPVLPEGVYTPRDMSVEFGDFSEKLSQVPEMPKGVTVPKDIEVQDDKKKDFGKMAVEKFGDIGKTDTDTSFDLSR